MKFLNGKSYRYLKRGQKKLREKFYNNLWFHFYGKTSTLDFHKEKENKNVHGEDWSEKLWVSMGKICLASVSYGPTCKLAQILILSYSLLKTTSFKFTYLRHWYSFAYYSNSDYEYPKYKYWKWNLDEKNIQIIFLSSCIIPQSK